MQQKTELRVVSAVADKKQVTFYLEDGETLIIKQGDHRLGDLLEVIIPITIRGEVAVVNLTDFSIYAAFEHKTQGLTKFFRIAKDKVNGWFGGKTATHETHIPEEGKMAILRAVAGETMTEQHVQEHGKPINMNDDVAENEVVVAVITTPAVPATATSPAQPEKKTIIPGVNAVKPLITHAVKANSPESVQAFFQRCATFIDKRQHSVDDLMRFLEKGDLPLAEDGSIIAYKMLRYKNREKGIFVDCHTQRVTQRVGSFVCVNESLVDLNRRNECSNGLHIARRGYLKGFNGDVCVLCKIDPEDVMVVPHNDPNKVRVKGYHILGVLSDAAMKALKDNLPMTSETEALTMVVNAIKGNHIDRIERVQINGQGGTDVVITPLKHDKNQGKENIDHSRSDLKKGAALDDEANTIGSVDPRDINKKVAEEHEKIIGNKADTIITDEIEETKTVPSMPAPRRYATELMTKFVNATTSDVARKVAEDILALKKKTKKSWDFLGITPENVISLNEAMSSKKPVTTEQPKKVSAKAPPPAKAKSPPKTPASEPAPVPSTDKGSKVEQARNLYAVWRKTGKSADHSNLVAFKKAAKKGWSALGFTPTEIKVIEEK